MHTVNANGAHIPALGLGNFRMPGEDVMRFVPKAIQLVFAISTRRRSMAMRRKWARPFNNPAWRAGKFS